MNNLVLTLNYDDPIHLFVNGKNIGHIARHNRDEKKIVLNFKDEVKILRQQLIPGDADAAN